MTSQRKNPKDGDDKTIVMMLAFLCVATEAESSLPRKVEILDRFDLSDAQIGKVCGATTGSVRNARMAYKKRS